MAQTKGNFRMMDTGTITPLDFGAVGDGTTNDTVALQAAFDTTTANIIDLCGKTYGINATVNITQGNLLVKNGTIKWVGTDIMPNDILVSMAGTEGSTYALVTSAYLETDYIIVNVADIGNFAANDYLLLQNTTEIWTTDTDWHASEHNHAEIVQVRIVDAPNNKLYLMTPLNSNFKGGETNIIKQTMRDNITFDGVNFEGNGVQQIFLGTDPVQGPGTADPSVKLTIPGLGLGLVADQTLTLVDLAVDPAVIPGTLATDFDRDVFTIDSFSESGSNTIAIISKASITGASGTGTDGGTNGKVYFGGHTAISAVRCSNLTIKDCQFIKVRKGIACNVSYNTLIETNRILSHLGPEGYGILIEEGCTETSIINNKILGTTAYGIFLNHISGDPINTYIKGNTIRGATSVGIYSYICNFVEIVNNNITMSNTDAIDLDRATYGIQTYAFGLKITDNTIRNFGSGASTEHRGSGIYYEPRYKVHSDGDSTQRSIYSGAYSTSTHSASALGNTNPCPWAQFKDNYIQGRAGDGHWNSNGITIKPNVMGLGPYGIQILGNTIKDVASCILVDGDFIGPSGTGTSDSPRLDAIMISNNLLQGGTYQDRDYALGIHFKCKIANQALGHRVPIIGNLIESRNLNEDVPATQLHDSLMRFGQSDGTFTAAHMSAIVGNTMYYGKYSIHTGLAANYPLDGGILIGNTMHAYEGQSTGTAATGAYVPLSVGKDPIGAPFDADSPLYSTQIGTLDAGAVNNFWGNNFTGG